MFELFRPTIETALRHGLTVGATVLVTKGLADQATATLLIGGGMGVFAVLWSFVKGLRASR